MPTPAHSPQRNDKHSAFRVLAVGDCNTWGINDPPIGNTILDKFCGNLKNDGYATACQNLGYGMASTREGVQLMRREAKAADIVLINFGLVDTWITSIPKIYIPYYPDNFLRKRLRKLLKFVKRRLRSPGIRRFIPVGPVVPIDEYAQNVREMISLARAKNPRSAILLWGSPPVQHDAARNANLERYNQRLEVLARESNALYISTANFVNKFPEEVAYLDAVHLNEAATEAIAARMAAVYRTQQLAAAG